MRETKIFSIIPLIHPPNETDPLIVFILYFNSITIMETKKFKIGTVTTRLTLKGVLKNTGIIKFMDCHVDVL